MKRSCILRNCIYNAADAALTWLNGAPATKLSLVAAAVQLLQYSGSSRCMGWALALRVARRAAAV
jgi:hypothetical protein